MIKVIVKLRRVVHKIDDAIVYVPKGTKLDDIPNYIEDNFEELHVEDKLDKHHEEQEWQSGLGLGDGFEDTFHEHEWRYEVLDDDGHQISGGHLY